MRKILHRLPSPLHRSLLLSVHPFELTQPIHSFIKYNSGSKAHRNVKTHNELTNLQTGAYYTVKVTFSHDFSLPVLGAYCTSVRIIFEFLWYTHAHALKSKRVIDIKKEKEKKIKH